MPPVATSQSYISSHTRDGSMAESLNSMRGNTDRLENKLPGIHLASNKLNGYKQAYHNQIGRQISKIDRNTMDNIYHVSEYCKGI